MTHPPFDRAAVEAMVMQGVNCDHHFGDDGLSKVCTKCSMDRDTANRIGHADYRRRVEQLRLRGEL